MGQGRIPEPLGSSGLAQRHPGFLHGWHGVGEESGHHGGNTGELLPEKVSPIHNFSLFTLGTLCPPEITHFRRVHPKALARLFNFPFEPKPGLLHRSCDANLFLRTRIFEPSLHVGDLLREVHHPRVLQDQFLGPDPLLVIKIIRLPDHFLLSRNQLVELSQPIKKLIERILAGLQDHDEPPKCVASAFLMTGRAHQAIPLEVQKSGLEGRGQLLRGGEGDGLPWPVLQRTLKGLLHCFQRS